MWVNFPDSTRLLHCHTEAIYYDDVIMSSMGSQITNLTIVYSNVYSGAEKRKHQSSAPVTGEFPTQRATSAEKVSIWWRHHCSPSTGGVILRDTGIIGAHLTPAEHNKRLTVSIIMRKNTRDISRYPFLQQTQKRLWTHKRHPIARPHGRAMACLLWVYRVNKVLAFFFRVVSNIVFYTTAIHRESIAPN